MEVQPDFTIIGQTPTSTIVFQLTYHSGRASPPAAICMCSGVAYADTLTLEEQAFVRLAIRTVKVVQECQGYERACAWPVSAQASSEKRGGASAGCHDDGQFSARRH
jgi:hypothetical protein